MAEIVDSATLQARLPAALERHLGVRGGPMNFARVTGGATKGTWIFEVERDGGVLQKLVLQLTTAEPSEDPLVASKMTAEYDAAVLRAARAHGVPVPEVLAVFDAQDGIGSGHITSWVAGETLAPRILRDDRFAQARSRLAAQCGEALAAIHRIPVESLPFLAVMDAETQYRRYRAQVDRHPSVKMPAIEWGLRWVRDHLPPPVPLTVVHGDFRLGNLIISEEGLACVIDWEITVRGDPMQDLGWLCLKTWRFGGARPVAGVGEREALFAGYERASGNKVDPERVRFWEAFGHVKWAIMCLGMGMGTPGAPAGSVSLEHCLIGRRIEEPLWDFLQLLDEGKA